MSISAKALSKSPVLTVRQVDNILTVGLDRPAKRNALNEEIIRSLEQVFTSLSHDVGAVVLYGNGDHFSAGLDLSELIERDATEGLLHSRAWHRCFDIIQQGRAPVVAALNGAVIGGGLELAAAAHIRVADESAYYALPEGQRGIFVGGGGSMRLPRLIGVSRMTDLMLTGRIYSAAEGLAFGLTQYVTPKGQAFEKAMALAKQIAQNAPMTNFAVLQALPAIAEASPQTGLLLEGLMASVAQSDQGAKDRIQAFLDRKAAKVKPV